MPVATGLLFKSAAVAMAPPAGVRGDGNRDACNSSEACCVQDTGQSEAHAKFAVVDGAIVMC